MRDSNNCRILLETDVFALARSKNVATVDESLTIDPDLANVIDRWSELPNAIRAAVVLLVEKGSQ